MLITGTLAVAAVCASPSTRTAEAATTAPGETALLYSDRSAGALFNAHVWYKVATSNGTAVTYTHDAEDFTQRLMSATWTRIAIMSRYTGSEPAYVNAVRSYAMTHPETLVEFQLWHDNGQAAPELTAVLGTAAIVTWNYGMTTTGYALAGGTVGSALASSVPGQMYPTFENVTPQRWESLWSVSAAAFENAVYPAPPVAPVSPCVAICDNEYVKDLALCDEKRAERIAICNALYGPGTSGYDPAKHTECITSANSKHSNCLKDALDDYKDCKLMCSLSAE